MNLSSHDRRRAVAERLRWQSGMCARLGSPLYGELLDRMAADVEERGPTWRVLEPFSDWPTESAYSDWARAPASTSSGGSSSGG